MTQTPGTTILGYCTSPWDALGDFVRGRTDVYPVHLSDVDRLQHVAIVGKSGMGKSNLLKRRLPPARSGQIFAQRSAVTSCS